MGCTSPFSSPLLLLDEEKKGRQRLERLRLKQEEGRLSLTGTSLLSARTALAAREDWVEDGRRLCSRRSFLPRWWSLAPLLAGVEGGLPQGPERPPPRHLSRQKKSRSLVSSALQSPLSLSQPGRILNRIVKNGGKLRKIPRRSKTKSENETSGNPRLN